MTWRYSQICVCTQGDLFLCSVSWESFTKQYPRNEGAHPAPRSGSQEPGLLWEMADSGTGAGYTHDEPEASYSTRKWDSTQQTHREGTHQRGTEDNWKSPKARARRACTTKWHLPCRIIPNKWCRYSSLKKGEQLPNCMLTMNTIHKLI